MEKKKMTKTIIKAVKREIKRKLKFYRGKNWVAIHKNTANDVIQILNKIERKKNVNA
jgi:hypothetical protein